MSEEPYEFWREYPDHDPQAIVWYPLTYGPVEPDLIWPELPAGPARGQTSFYLHVPFCAIVCPFCPFNKFQARESPMREFVDVVRQEMRMLAAHQYWSAVPLRAGYLGGGTPTALSAGQLGELLDECRRLLAFTEATELTVEGSPETITAEKLAVLLGSGVNRISFGVQSFDDRYLRMLGRGHDAATARRTVDLVREAGFANVAIDLMYRLPGQTVAEWRDDLDAAVRSGVDHISIYSLFVEPGSPLARVRRNGRLLPQADDAADLDMFELAIDVLGEAGYELYTLYDFARPDRKCDHHLVNWQAPQAEYIGIGPGAFSYAERAATSFVYGNINALDEYFGAVRSGRLPIDFGVELDREEEMARYMALGANAQSIPKQPFAERFSVPVDEVFGPTIERLAGWGLVEDRPDEVRLTRRGALYVANVGKAFTTQKNRMKPHPAGVDLQRGAGESLIGVTERNVP